MGETEEDGPRPACRGAGRRVRLWASRVPRTAAGRDCGLRVLSSHRATVSAHPSSAPAPPLLRAPSLRKPPEKRGQPVGPGGEGRGAGLPWSGRTGAHTLMAPPVASP